MTLENPLKDETVGNIENASGNLENTNGKRTNSGSIGQVKKQKASSGKIQDKEMPLAERTIGSAITVGAHCSIAKGIQNAVKNSVNIGGNAFALFLKPKGTWKVPELQQENVDLFRSACQDQGYTSKNILPHAPYLISLASANLETRQKSYDSFVEDLRRCHRLGIKYYNFHPGSAGKDNTVEDGIRLVAAAINRALEETESTVAVLENSASLGNAVGSTFEQLAAVIDLIKDKSRVGVCIDTCHAFAAGYDIRTEETYAQTMSRFEKSVGFEYLKGIHLNDSRAELGAGRDLHANIGQGYIGLEAFRLVVNDTRLQGLPMILETPPVVIKVGEAKSKQEEDHSIWAREIKLLEWLVGKKEDDPELLERSKELQVLGAADRTHQQKKRIKKEERTGKR